MTPKFKIGDVVQLKSGGPEMMVSETPAFEALGPSFEDYRCQWFLSGKLHHGSFKADVLVKVPPAHK